MFLADRYIIGTCPKCGNEIKGDECEKCGSLLTIDEVKDTIKRVARLTLDFDEISELDINPIFVYEKGSSALDIKIKL